MDLAAFLALHGIAGRRVEHPPVTTVEESERLVPPLPIEKPLPVTLITRRMLYRSTSPGIVPSRMSATCSTSTVESPAFTTGAVPMFPADFTNTCGTSTWTW